MLTKEELNNLRYLAEDIKELEAELDALYTKIEGVCSPKFSDEPKGGEKPDILVLYDDIMQKQKEINLLNKTYYRERERIQKIISNLDDKSYSIIYLRYFENMPWCNIAESMRYTRQHLHRLHSAVLTMLKSS